MSEIETIIATHHINYEHQIKESSQQLEMMFIANRANEAVVRREGASNAVEIVSIIELLT